MQQQGEGGRPRRLGRGLSSLVDPGTPVRIIRRPTPATTPAAEAHSERSLSWLSVGRLVPNRYQPRRSFNDDGLEALADSIKRSGMMQPVVVRAMVNGQYELIAGERRWRAAKMAGLEELPALVRVVEDEEAAELALIENIHREDLNAVDRARAFRQLSDDFGLTQQQISERVGLGRANVANLMRLLDLDEGTLGLIAAGKLSAGHGKALLGVLDPAVRYRVAERAARDRWTVRRTERVAGDPKALLEGTPDNSTQTYKVAALVDLEKRLSAHLGTKVVLSTDKSGKRGKMVLSFYDLDHLDGLLAKIGLPGESV